MKSGTHDRDLVWETLSGKLVQIHSRRLISFQQRHVAAISYEVTILNAAAPVLISSEVVYLRPEEQKGAHDPRQAKFAGKWLRPVVTRAADRRIVLVNATDQSGMALACGIDHDFESQCPHEYKSDHDPNSGRIVFTINAEPREPIHITKYMAYHTSNIADANEVGNRAEW